MTPTADLCDANLQMLADGALQIAHPGFIAFGAVSAFCGAVVTLRVQHDNALVRAVLEEPGQGRVLVVDNAGSLYCALVGGNLAQIAERNGWSGVIVNGCVRDVDEIDQAKIGVLALATSPRRPGREGTGERDAVLQFAGVIVRPGDWVAVDRDGWLVSSTPL